ncbi:MAG: hypothetical protein ACFB51_02710 [Anaerolineae bacterium]
MHIEQLDPADRRAVGQFIRLPFHLYRSDPRWVPPLLPGERERFKPDFAYYQHSEAAFFTVYSAGQMVGRIAVLVHCPHNAYRGTRDALLYLYECIDDDEAARQLFEAAAGWASGRGLNRLVGPKGFFTAEGIGLQVEGFTEKVSFGIPYNPPYYQRHWEAIGGMQTANEYVSAIAYREGFEMPERILRLAKKIRKRRGFHVPHFTDRRQILDYVDDIKQAYNEAFAPLWAYTPVPDVEVEAIVRRMLFVLGDPNLVTIVLKGDDMVGFQFIYPDIAPIVRFMRGRLNPLTALLIVLHRRFARRLLANGNAILPAYQGLGANAVLYEAMLHTLAEGQAQEVELVQIETANAAMLSDMEHIIGSRIVKRHRVYQRDL